MTKVIATLLALLAGFALASTSKIATASVINVDFSTVMNGTSYSSTAAPDYYPGSHWNDVGNGGSGSAIPLADSTNTATGATLSWSGANSSDTNFATNALPMLYQCIYTNQTPQLVTIGGLNDSQSYNLYLASEWKNVWGASFTVGASTASTTGAQGQTWVNGVNYVEFAGIHPVGNQIAITFNGNLGIFNGFQLQTVPEPSTVVLMGVGAIGLCLAGRRNRRA